MILTRELLKSMRTRRGGYTGATLSALEPNWKTLSSKWLKRLIGKEFDESTIQKAVDGRLLRYNPSTNLPTEPKEVDERKRKNCKRSTETLKKRGYDSYRKYLKSHDWEMVKKEFFQSGYYKGYCYCCKAIGTLSVHHTTYKRVTMEKAKDLRAVCDSCHKRIHEVETTEHIPLYIAHKFVRKERWKTKSTERI